MWQGEYGRGPLYLYKFAFLIIYLFQLATLLTVYQQKDLAKG